MIIYIQPRQNTNFTLVDPSASCWDKLDSLSMCSQFKAALYFWTKLAASEKSLWHGGSRGRGAQIFASQDWQLFMAPPHELTTTAAGTPPCWCSALLCSSSEPCSVPSSETVSGAHLANVSQTPLSARQTVMLLCNGQGMCWNASVFAPAIMFRAMSVPTLVTFCWTPKAKTIRHKHPHNVLSFYYTLTILRKNILLLQFFRN